jgi:putative hydrolase of the HAD superfamily
MRKEVLRRSDFDAVTFDVFGTLLDWEPEIASFFRAWAARNGLAVSDREILTAYDRLRQPLQDLRPALRYPEVLRRTFDAVAAEHDRRVDGNDRDAFGEIAASHAPFEDSRSALSALRSLGLTLGALSNIDERSFAQATERAGISFDVVVTAERVGAYKPDHTHFWAALSDLLAMGIPRERVLHVAQSRRADIVPANRIGLSCVWVDRPGHLFGRAGCGAEDARPDWQVSSLADLVDRLE